MLSRHVTIDNRSEDLVKENEDFLRERIRVLEDRVVELENEVLKSRVKELERERYDLIKGIEYWERVRRIKCQE